jgi:hypothetical protein
MRFLVVEPNVGQHVDGPEYLADTQKDGGRYGFRSRLVTLALGNTNPDHHPTGVVLASLTSER